MTPISPESAAVQSHLSILQGIINRMAANSANCKTWCVTLVAALLVVVADKDKPEYLWVCAIPVLLFLLLDSYYLALERRFRTAYNEFIAKLHTGTATLEDVFILTPGDDTRGLARLTFKAFWSASVLPFYGLLTIMLIVIGVRILRRVVGAT